MPLPFLYSVKGLTSKDATDDAASTAVRWASGTSDVSKRNSAYIIQPLPVVEPRSDDEVRITLSVL